MSKEEIIETEGVVLVALPNALFTVELTGGAEIICYLSGRIRRNHINVLPGDKVRR